MWQPGSPRDESRSFITIDHRILNKCDIPEAEIGFENKTRRKSPRMRSPLGVCQVEPLFQSSPDSKRAPVADLGQAEGSRKLGTNFNWTCSDLLEGTLGSIQRTPGSTRWYADLWGRISRLWSQLTLTLLCSMPLTVACCFQLTLLCIFWQQLPFLPVPICSLFFLSWKARLWQLPFGFC